MTEPGALTVTHKEQVAFAAVERARHPDRPRFLALLDTLVDEWMELSGDRLFHNDAAIVGGVGRIGDQWAVVIGQEKGVDAATRVKHNFGMPHPEGYRKAQRLMRLAEKFSLPVVAVVDTPAAHAGIGAEERGQAWAIATSLSTMIDLKTPLLTLILSEGGSGGALALAMGDRVLALENAIYTVAPPETCAAILYHDANQKARAAAALAPGAPSAKALGVVDELIPEPEPGAHAHRDVVMAALRGATIRRLKELQAIPIETLLEQRHLRYRTPTHGVLPL